MSSCIFNKSKDVKDIIRIYFPKSETFALFEIEESLLVWMKIL